MKFRHLGVAVARLEGVEESYSAIFGYKLLSGPFSDPIQKVQVCFLGTDDEKDAVIEIIAPLSNDGPLRSILARGGGAYHMCFETEKLEASLGILEDQGCLIVARPVPAVAFGGRRIAWIFTPTRQLIELLEAEG
jgi:methylmalonyl-CoA/ethylmalonyl-CoA epimerase